MDPVLKMMATLSPWRTTCGSAALLRTFEIDPRGLSVCCQYSSPALAVVASFVIYVCLKILYDGLTVQVAFVLHTYLSLLLQFIKSLVLKNLPVFVLSFRWLIYHINNYFHIIKEGKRLLIE